MDLSLKKEKLSFVKSVFESVFTHEETMEVIVPDAQPDVLQIIDTTATLLLRAKDADNGRVSVSGEVKASVLYTPENENSVRKVDVSIPFTALAEGKGISPDCSIIASLALNSASAAMINPRKLNVRADVIIDVACYESADIFISTETIDDEDCNEIEILRANESFSLISAVKEKTFVINEDFTMPATKPAFADILSTDAKVIIEDTKSVGTKLIIKGVAMVDLLYRAEQNNEICSVEFSNVFSQIIEMDSFSENSSSDVRFMLTGAYISENTLSSADSQSLTIELHAVAQCLVRAEEEVSYIADVYSTCRDLGCTRDEFKLKNYIDSSSVNEILKGSISCGGVQSVLSSRAAISPVTVTENGEEITLSANVDIHILYCNDDNQVQCACQKSAVTAKIDAECGCTYSAQAALAGEIYVTFSDSGFDYRVPVTFTYDRSCETSIDSIFEMSLSEDNCAMQSRPSIIIYKTQEGDRLWDLGKRYTSTRDLIIAANELDEVSKLPAGQLLIIPRKR